MAGRMRGRRVLLSDSSEDDDIDVDVILPHPQTRFPSPEGADEIEEDEQEEEQEEREEEDRPMSATSEDFRSDPAAAASTGHVPAGNGHQGNGGHGYEGNGNWGYHAAGQGSPLETLFRQRGVYVEPLWVHSCIQEMEVMHPGFRNFGVERQGEMVLGHILVADFNAMGAGCLPPSFETLHMTELPGPFVLQVGYIPFFINYDPLFT